MAVTQHKHSSSRAQGSRRNAHAKTKPAATHLPQKPRRNTKEAGRAETPRNRSAKTKLQTSTRKHRNAKRPKKRERVPAALRFTETKRGKTTVRRYRGRTFYRFEEIKGKPVDFVEVFTTGEYHSIDVRFQDKTAFHFIINPGFILETEYADWKTGNWRSIKRWPPIHSETLG